MTVKYIKQCIRQYRWNFSHWLIPYCPNVSENARLGINTIVGNSQNIYIEGNSTLKRDSVIMNGREKFIMKKDKEETNENDDDNKQQKNADARKVHADAEKTEDLPKNHEKGSETVNFDNQEKQARCRAQAAIWYEDEGFERIQAIRKTLESENRNRFSVNREGICSISIGKRKYRRVGILKGYPFGQTEVIREKLKKDGFITSMGCNNYLWISW